MSSTPSAHDLLESLLELQILMARLSEAFFHSYKITDAQFNILNLLAYRQGKMNQAELVELLLVGKSTVSILLKRLERARYIRSRPHVQDRRQVVISLTVKGHQLWEKISPAYEKRVEKIFGTLSAGRRKGFLDIVAELKSGLDEIHYNMKTDNS